MNNKNFDNKTINIECYLSDGSNGRPRLRLGGPRKPLPDFPFDSSTRARRPHIVRPSNPRTASSASRASSNSTNAKLFRKKIFFNPVELSLKKTKITQADYELSKRFVTDRNSWMNLPNRFCEHYFPARQRRLYSHSDNVTFSSTEIFFSFFYFMCGKFFVRQNGENVKSIKFILEIFT